MFPFSIPFCRAQVEGKKSKLSLTDVAHTYSREKHVHTSRHIKTQMLHIGEHRLIESLTPLIVTH
jgi:hypothetical protein